MNEPSRIGAIDLSGLGSISQLMETPTAQQSPFRELPIDSIHPDPEQPRKTFDAEKLAELATSIRAQGIIQPLIVSEDPKGGYMIVAGERRWRAAKTVPLATVPVVLKNGHSARAQMVENLQREDLTAFEIYRAIAAEIDQGASPSELATEYGKSKAWISDYTSVSKMAAPLQDALREGRATDISALAQLHRLHKTAPDEVEKLAASGAQITRHLVTQLADKLARDVTGAAPPIIDAGAAPPPAAPPPGPSDVSSSDDQEPSTPDVTPAPPPASPREPDAERPAPSRGGDRLPVEVRATYDGETYSVRYDKQRADEGQTLIMMTSDSGSTIYAPIADLVLVSITY